MDHREQARRPRPASSPGRDADRSDRRTPGARARGSAGSLRQSSTPRGLSAARSASSAAPCTRSAAASSACARSCAEPRRLGGRPTARERALRATGRAVGRATHVCSRRSTRRERFATSSRARDGDAARGLQVERDHAQAGAARRRPATTAAVLGRSTTRSPGRRVDRRRRDSRAVPGCAHLRPGASLRAARRIRAGELPTGQAVKDLRHALQIVREAQPESSASRQRARRSRPLGRATTCTSARSPRPPQCFDRRDLATSAAGGVDRRFRAVQALRRGPSSTTLADGVRAQGESGGANAPASPEPRAG